MIPRPTSRRGRLRSPALSVLLLAASLAAQTEADKAMHVLQRAAFGPTPGLLQQLSASHNARLAWINQQLTLDPLVENQALTDALAAFNQLPPWFLPANQGDPGNIPSLGAAQLARALLADAQLNEVMTFFWETHFNTFAFKVKVYFDGKQVPDGEAWATYFEKQDNDAYREHALGKFEKLLQITAESVAMLIYLDNDANTATNLNENWARELLELFTCGQIWASAPAVANPTNYTQQDIIDVGKCFTGWSVEENPNDVFAFATNDGEHDTTAKSIFEVTGRTLLIPAGGTAKADGDAVVRYLARSPRTKDFIVRKLMRFFLSDTAPEDHPQLLAAATTAWGLDGNIRAVVEVLLESPVFLDATYAWSQISNPFHFTISRQRAVDAFIHPTAGTPSVPDLWRLTGTGAWMYLMGQSLHQFPAPDGYPLASEEQVGSSVFLDHVGFGSQFTDNGSFSLILQPHLVVMANLPPALQSRPQAVADFLLRMFFADKPLNPGDADLVAQLLQGIDPSNTIPYGLQLQSACEFITGMTHAALK